MKLLYTLILLLLSCSTEPEDACGVAGGDGSSCVDCAGVPNGSSYEDECGGCDANVNNDCVQDECGVWGGGDVVYCSQGWICKTDYIDIAEDICTVVTIVAETPDILLPIIYNSLDECESVCPNEPVAITNACFPNGTGGYTQMYCSETE